MEQGDVRQQQEKFGRRIKALREKKGWTQNQLAEASGVPRTDLPQVEHGQLDITLATIHALAKGLGVKPAELFEES